MKYSVQRTKTVKVITVKNHHDATTADSRRRLTNFKMLVRQSLSLGLTTVCLMLNLVFKVFSETCQQFAEDAVKIRNIFLDFQL